MDFKVYGVASYSSDIDLLRDYYSDEYIDLLLKPDGDMLVSVIDCESLDDAKEVLLLESARWLNNLISDTDKVNFDKIVSLSDKGVLKGVALDDNCYLNDFRLTDRECRMDLKLDTNYTIRYAIVEAMYCFNSNEY